MPYLQIDESKGYAHIVDRPAWGNRHNIECQVFLVQPEVQKVRRLINEGFTVYGGVVEPVTDGIRASISLLLDTSRLYHETSFYKSVEELRTWAANGGVITGRYSTQRYDHGDVAVFSKDMSDKQLQLYVMTI